MCPRIGLKGRRKLLQDAVLSQSVDSQSDTVPPSTVPDSPREGVWAGLIGVTFVVSMALAYRPTLDSFGEVVDALLPWLVLAGMVLAWSGRTFPTRLVGLLTAIVQICYI
jgi:hypothetical protein